MDPLHPLPDGILLLFSGFSRGPPVFLRSDSVSNERFKELRRSVVHKRFQWPVGLPHSSLRFQRPARHILERGYSISPGEKQKKKQKCSETAEKTAGKNVGVSPWEAMTL